MTRRYNFEHLYRITDVNGGLIGALGIGVDGLVNWTHPSLGHLRGLQYPLLNSYCRDHAWRLDNITERVLGELAGSEPVD